MKLTFQQELAPPAETPIPKLKSVVDTTVSKLDSNCDGLFDATKQKNRDFEMELVFFFFKKYSKVEKYNILNWLICKLLRVVLIMQEKNG